MISDDVAEYVAEFNEFRQELDEQNGANAYGDLPSRLQHQWDLMAPDQVRRGERTTIPVCVGSDLGKMSIGSYRILVGKDGRVTLDDNAIEWVPRLERGVTVPQRADNLAPAKMNSSDSIWDTLSSLTDFADRFEERVELALEELEIEPAHYGRSSSRQSSRDSRYSSNKERVAKDAGKAARSAVKKLKTPWSSEDVEGVDLVKFLKRGKEPVWLTQLDKRFQEQIWAHLGKASDLILKKFKMADVGAKHEDFWNWFAYDLTRSGNGTGLEARCKKYGKVIPLEKTGMCSHTNCQFHPSKNISSVRKQSTCYHQQIKANI